MEWEIVACCPTYEINCLGQIRRIDSGRIKTAVVAANGYLVVNLWRANKGRVYCVHSLLAEAFLGPRPDAETVNHIDGNRLNNSLDNLEYMSNAENARDMWRRGRGCAGERNGHSKLTADQVRAIHSRANAGERTCHLAKEYGVGSPIISQIKHGTRWQRYLMASANFSS
jgi:hypothetical protein